MKYTKANTDYLLIPKVENNILKVARLNVEYIEMLPYTKSDLRMSTSIKKINKVLDLFNAEEFISLDLTMEEFESYAKANPYGKENGKKQVNKGKIFEELIYKKVGLEKVWTKEKNAEADLVISGIRYQAKYFKAELF